MSQALTDSKIKIFTQNPHL